MRCPAASRRGVGVCLLLCLVGGLNLLLQGEELASQHASLGWPSVVGRVAGDRDTAWYEYSVAGEKHTSSQFTIAPRWALLHRIPEPGAAVDVFYRPDQPWVSTISPGLTAEMALPAGFSVLICMTGLRGFARIFRVLRLRRSRRVGRAGS